jgi:hypothetical protein
MFLSYLQCKIQKFLSNSLQRILGFGQSYLQNDHFRSFLFKLNFILSRIFRIDQRCYWFWNLTDFFIILLKILVVYWVKMRMILSQSNNLLDFRLLLRNVQTLAVLDVLNWCAALHAVGMRMFHGRRSEGGLGFYHRIALRSVSRSSLIDLLGKDTRILGTSRCSSVNRLRKWAIILILILVIDSNSSPQFLFVLLFKHIINKWEPSMQK